jgi:hypothetical protein
LALNKFEVVEKDGGVYVKGSEADIKGGSRRVNVKTKPTSDDKLVIVGRSVFCTVETAIPS